MHAKVVEFIEKAEKAGSLVMAYGHVHPERLYMYCNSIMQVCDRISNHEIK